MSNVLEFDPSKRKPKIVGPTIEDLPPFIPGTLHLYPGGIIHMEDFKFKDSLNLTREAMTMMALKWACDEIMRATTCIVDSLEDEDA